MTFTPADEAPRRTTSKPRSKPRASAPRPSTRSLRTEIDGFVAFTNSILAIVAPRDALDPIELAALVHAIDEETKTNPRFRRGLEALLSVTSGGSLMMVVAIIAARRVGRHAPIGRFGQVIDDGGAFILSTINAEPSEAAATMQSIVDMFTKPADNNGTSDAARTTDTATGASAA